MIPSSLQWKLIAVEAGSWVLGYAMLCRGGRVSGGGEGKEEEEKEEEEEDNDDILSSIQ